MCSFGIGAVAVLQHDGDLVASRALRWRWVISTGDFDPAVTRPCVGFGLFRRRGAAFLRARLSLPSPGTRDLLCGPIDSWHVS